MLNTAGSVPVHRARLIVVLASIAGCAGLLWLARDYTFFYDEWTFIVTAPDWTVATFFRPHNEHPAILFRLVYWTLLNTVGLRSYVPYMVVTVLLHLANVVLLFELVRRRAGELVGLAAALLLLLLGAGWEDMLWAFQMAWLASVALGLVSLLNLSRPPLAALSLACSLAFSGIGLVFAVAAVTSFALSPGHRRALMWLVPVGVGLLTWVAIFGPEGNHPNPPPTAANVLLVPAYAAWGLAASAGGVAGVAGWAGLICLAVAAAAVAAAWWKRRPDPLAVGVAVALVSFYVITGLTRAQLGYQQSGSARYVYVGSLLWIVLLADAAGALPWRGLWRPVLATVFVLALANGGAVLVTSAGSREAVMERQVADYYALAAMRSDRCLDPAGAVDRQAMPVETKPADYYRATDRYGDPRDGMPLVDKVSFEAGVRSLRGYC